MKLTVFGSSGRTGRHLLIEAARREHEVTAFTRRPETLAEEQANLRIVSGDGRDPIPVAAAVAGADAVIAIIAARSRRGPHQAAAVAETITTAMSELGVRRLLFTSAYPIVGHRPRLPMALLRRFFAAAYADAAEMEGILTAGDLEWTVVRLNRLIDGAATGELIVTPELLAEPGAIARADAAAALLDLIEGERFVGIAVNATS
jgi:putative NADH-flavin reductase